MYGRECAGERIYGGPRGLEEIEADLAGFEVDVWMADGRGECDCRWGEGVIGWEGEGE